jgi:hypothetical protein
MLKYALLGAAMAISAPAFAQTQTTPQTTNPAPTDPATVPSAPTAPVADATTQAAPADSTVAAEPAPAAEPVPAEQAATVIDEQFATYDKDTDGKLNQAEFSAWMVALKSQTDPKTDANAPATKTWNKAAFTQADKDKSKSVSKAEIAGFLTPAKS